MNRVLVALLIVCASAARAQQSNPAVVISQVYGGGGNSGAPLLNDYVELFNRGDATVSLVGWSVQYASATGTGNFSANPVVTLSGSLAPGQYYLVQQASGGSAGAALPTADATGTVNMSGTAGKVALVSSPAGLACNGGSTPCTAEQTALIVDLVGYGTANFSEGPPAPGLSNTTAAVRAGGGCVDSGNNSVDFAAAPPVPRNTASAPNVCGVSAPLVISNASPLPPATVGQAYTVTFTASGGSGSGYTFSSAGGVFPPGLALSGAVLSGTPSDATSSPFHFTMRVTDSLNAIAEKSFELAVNPAASCVPTRTISQIQGEGATSPVAGQPVTTSGIVTALRSNGFFLQTPDLVVGATSASRGIFVFTSATPPTPALVGNQVCVSGTVQEFSPATDPNSRPLTEITTPVVSLIAAGQALPAPVTLTAVDTSPSGGLDVLEKYEGMRVRVDSLTVVAPTSGSVSEASATGSSNGVFYGVMAGVARPFREAGVQLPDPLPAGAPAGVPRFDANPERIRVDSDAQPGAARLEVTSGATVANLAGVLDYAFRTYTILPDPAPAPVVTGNVSFTPVPAAGANELSVASFNLQRFFDTVNDPSVSDVALTTAAFNNRLNKASLTVRNVLHLPDILAVVEAENLPVLEALAAKVNSDVTAASQPNPEYRAYLLEGNDIGGIDVGFLVKSARVTVLDVSQVGKTATYTDPNTGQAATLNDRPPLVLRAVVSGAKFTVIANHLRSLTDVETDPRVRAKRRAQAEFLAALIQQRQVADPTERIISVGDYNAFEVNDGFVDVIGAILGTPAPAAQVIESSADLVNPDLKDMVDLVPADQRYSYLFDGNAQVLDHILMNNRALAVFVRGAYGRVNADFPESYRSDPDRPERLSDHDPVVAHFSIPTSNAGDVTANVLVFNSGIAYDYEARIWSGSVTIANAGTAPIPGPLQIVLVNLAPGLTVANSSGNLNGAPYVTSAGDLLPGQSRRVNLTLDGASTASITYFVRVYSGAF